MSITFIRLKGTQYKYLDKNHTISVETRHGIIEYEGSPRRIGQMGNTNDDEHMPRVSNKLSQNHTITPNVKLQHTMQKPDKLIAVAMLHQ
ncbi:hypothetical protein DOY81_014350 [Sarcophaga bullata]|nr:hypothetical protein DOY81_014350 [Sarcophaga bullata]